MMKAEDQIKVVDGITEIFAKIKSLEARLAEKKEAQELIVREVNSLDVALSNARIEMTRMVNPYLDANTLAVQKMGLLSR